MPKVHRTKHIPGFIPGICLYLSGKRSPTKCISFCRRDERRGPRKTCFVGFKKPISVLSLALKFAQELNELMGSDFGLNEVAIGLVLYVGANVIALF